MIINRGFKFKLKPKPTDREKCYQSAGAKRYVFNRGLDQRITAFTTTGQSPSYFDQNKELTFLKEQPETSWMQVIPRQVVQQGL